MSSGSAAEHVNTPMQEIEVARLLLEARRERRPISSIAHLFPAGSLEAAYRVQKINADAARAHGLRQVGRKIGLTSLSVQRQLGVDQPDCGVLFEDMWFSDGDVLPIERLMQPRIEAEIAFVLGRDVTVDGASHEQLQAAIDHVVVAAEIVDSAIAGWKISLVDTVADNASCGLFALGNQRHSIAGLDLRLCGMVLSRNGADASFGVGAACLGHPLNAVKWLADVAVRLGEPLRAGEIILSGALGSMVDVAAGDVFRIEVAGLGELVVPFSAETRS